MMGNRTVRILVVDHDRLPRKHLCNLAEHSGCEALEADNGREGLDKARESRPDIIITGAGLPAMDGIELVRAVRATSDSYRPYIILATNLDDENRLVEAFDAGVDDFIGKPLRPRVVAARLRAAQRLVRLQRENERNIDELQRFSEQLTRSNFRLRELAVTDELTGLPNRRYAMERMKQEWSASTRRQGPLSCMIIDLDGLKQINDVQGHERGDVVLKTVAAVLKKLVRTQDVVCRISGDEFLVICPGTPLDALLACGERLMNTVGSFGIQAEGYSLGLTIGAAERRPEIETPQDLIGIAEQGMLIAQGQGKNRIHAVQNVESRDRRRRRGNSEPRPAVGTESRGSQANVLPLAGRLSLA